MTVSTARRLGSTLLAVGLVPAVLALPVVTRPHASPHPVPGHVASVRLSGVDASAWSGLQRDSRALAARLRTGAHDARRPVVLTGERTASTFSGIGVTWLPTAGAAAPVINVRVHQDGRWTAWQALETTDIGPDPTSAEARSSGVRTGTEPLLTDPSDAYQVRVDPGSGPLPRDLRVDLVDPGTSAADSDLTPAAPTSSAEAQTNAPTIITRAQWGADESIRQGSPTYMPTIVAGFIHHTDTSNTYTEAGAAAQVRSIYLYHVQANGWSDIGYNFLVDRFGRVFEGRYGGVDKAVRGAHTGGFNTNTFGVAALGTFTSVAPSSAMISGIERVFAWKFDLNHRDPTAKTTLTAATFSGSRYAAGTRVTINTISGHRDMDYTTCPGSLMYAKLPAIRAAVKSLMGKTIYDPAQNLSSITPGTQATLQLSAHTNAVAPWTFTVTDPKGVVVRTQSGTSTPSLTATWDTTVGGKPAPVGVYRLLLQSSTARPVASTLTVTKPFVYDPPPPAGTPPPYWKMGYQTYGGRQWYTACEYYGTSGAYRCLAKIKASVYVRTATGYTSALTWVGNSWSYYDYARPAWSQIRLAVPGTFTSGGHTWKTTCVPSASTGPRTCNTWMWGTVITRTLVNGTYRYGTASTWIFSSRVFLVPVPA